MTTFVNRSAPNLMCRSNSAMPTSCSMVTETESRNRILGVRVPDLVSIRYYVHNSLPICTKFCKHLRNVVASPPICETNRKQFADFWRCADTYFRSFQALVSTSFNRSAPDPMYRYKFGNADFVFDGE